MLVFSLDEIVEGGHDVERFGINQELRALCTVLLGDCWFEGMIHVEVGVKYVAITFWPASTV